MKIKHKYIYILFALFLCQLAFSSQVTGQNKKQIKEKCLYHFDDLSRKQTWTDSYNAAGLGFIDFNNSSFIEAYMGKGDGALVKYNESDDNFNFGLRTASYKKINKTTFFGKIDYNNFRGQNMTWSGLIYPERYLLAVADSRPAEKRKESYKLSGGFSTPIATNLIFGAQINYETADLAKMKDLRHLTKLLDFEVTGGLIYKAGMFNIGANYYYRKFHEKVTFSKVADDDILYTGYLFKGLWFGMFENWTNDALNLSRPFTDVIKGGSVQVEFLKEKFKFHNEFTYKSQEGLTGPGADKAFSQSEAETYEYKGIASFEQDHIRHYLKVNANYSDATNYDKVTNQERIGGIYVTFYYGLNKAFSRRNFNLNGEYEIALGRYKCNPNWNLKAGYSYTAQTSISSIVNPLYYTQDVRVASAYGKVNKNFILDKGMIDLSLLGAYSSGSGIKQRESISENAVGINLEDVVATQVTALLNREYEFLTAGKFQGEAGFRYSRFVSTQNTAGSIYLDLKYSFTKAKELKYHDGDNAGVFYMALGYSF